MPDEKLLAALNDPDPSVLRRYIDERLIEALKNHPDVLAAQREYAEWEDKVINGDPTASDAPKGVIRGPLTTIWGIPVVEDDTPPADEIRMVAGDGTERQTVTVKIKDGHFVGYVEGDDA